MATFFEPSLFPQKEDFNLNEYLDSIEETELSDILHEAIMQAFGIVRDYCDTNGASIRLMADMLHECVFNCIREEVERRQCSADFEFSENIYGNERLSFRFNGYTYIIRSLEASYNHTKQTEKIKEQEYANHIITLGYRLAPLQEKIASIELSYIKGNDTIFCKSVSTEGSFEPIRVAPTVAIKSNLKIRERKSEEAI